MKKIIKAVVSFSLAFCMLLAIPACGSSNKTNGSTKNNDITNANNQKRYVVNLTLDNYTDYFNIKTYSISNMVSAYKVEFSGCVYNGIYENCVVTYECNNANGTVTEDIKLNMGGNGVSNTTGNSPKIVAITGTVTYWK